ncbi:OmpP1/FadL family transporter [Paludisphaera soli]|uniref:OmpP1/FadL family transporter n=1 Tax=Paludisphaera soli TaxID=2712865 RepID=UPI0013EB575A|nr:outer membrane protein transport protein [Paludisphaera soli]
MKSRRPTFVLLALVGVTSSASAQGLISPGAGPINRAMAGASTAAPVDFGSTYWNPANLSGLDRPEFLLGSELIIPSTHLTTSLPAGAINGVLPREGRYGVSRSDSGVVPNLATGVAFRLSDDSHWTFGLGIFGYVGGNVNFAGSETTPLLASRRPPRSFGFGPIWANASMLTINPSASVRLTDRLSVGGGPVISNMALGFSPAFFAPGPRDDLGLNTYPTGTNARAFWGGGFQLGLLYEMSEDWNLGFSYKSPIWQERWGFNAATPDLSARRIGIQAQIPAIYSWGVAYKGFDRALIDVDLRYVDYANAALFGESVQDGGLGWRGAFAVAVGGQYALTERTTVRGGYLYNTNPIPDTATLFNVQLPGIITNTLSLGGSFRLTDDVTMSLAWVHGFRNSIEGGIREEALATAKIDSQYDSIVAGFNVQFGGRPGADRRNRPAPRPDESGLVE